MVGVELVEELVLLLLLLLLLLFAADELELLPPLVVALAEAAAAAALNNLTSSELADEEDVEPALVDCCCWSCWPIEPPAMWRCCIVIDFILLMLECQIILLFGARASISKLSPFVCFFSFSLSLALQIVWF